MRNTSLRALNVVQCVWVHTVATLLCRDVFRAEVSFFMRDSRVKANQNGFPIPTVKALDFIRFLVLLVIKS